jgi:adenosylcobinamide kinase / adenosylcobinamide-phosphate guanylyltransferase
MAQDSSIIFITGGVRSGKSSFAEKMASEMWQSSICSQLHYIAAMQVTDSEMRNRIIRHQEDRVQSRLPWLTWEKPVSIGELAPLFQEGDIVLLDCLTTWLNNELFFQNEAWQDEPFRKQLFEKMLSGIDGISRQVKTLIIVSNEVLHEPLGSNELILVYNLLLGKLHQAIVSSARQAYSVESGIPLLMKGGA